MAGEPADAGVFAAAAPAIDRHVQLGVASGRVLQVTFPTEPDPEAAATHPILEVVLGYLESGDPTEIADVSVALTVPTDRRRVLEAVRSIPAGEEVSVETLARMTAGLDSADVDDRALVETALAANPAPLLVPDHRVREPVGATPAAVRDHLRSLEGL